MSLTRFGGSSIAEHWDAGGVDSAIADYLAGLHRRTFANTLWTGVFASPEATTAAAEKIAAAADLTKAANGTWKGHGKSGGGEPIELSINGSTVYMSDLPR